MFRSTEPPQQGLREYLSRELNRLSTELADGASIFPTMINGWQNIGGQFEPLHYSRNHHGLVVLGGSVEGAAGGTNSYITVMMLPERYRPANTKVFAATQGGATGGQYLRVDVRSTGEVAAYLWNQTWLSLSGISFYVGR